MRYLGVWQFFLPSEIVLTLYGKEGKKLQVNNYHERMNMPGFFNVKYVEKLYGKKVSLFIGEITPDHQ